MSDFQKQYALWDEFLSTLNAQEKTARSRDRPNLDAQKLADLQEDLSCSRGVSLGCWGF